MLRKQAYCVGDASQAQHDNGEISELASELISANLRSLLPKPFTKKNRLKIRRFVLFI
jgi:hypothetical protein